MGQSGSDHSSLSSASDDEFVYSSCDSLVSEDIDTDCFPLLSLDTEVLPYRFKPEPSPEPTMDSTTDVFLVTDKEDEPSSRMGNTNWYKLSIT